MITKTPLLPSWVHSLDDYRAMFDLTDTDLEHSLLDYPACVSSFNAEMHAVGRKVISADPFYHLSSLEMSKRVDTIIQRLGTQLHRYVDRIQSDDPEKSQENIITAWNHYAQLFLTDYSEGQLDGRYRAASLPTLPFDHFQFQLALCPDLLFRNDTESPEQVINELCRVAHEVRVFPLLDDEGEIADELGPVMLALQQSNYGVEVREVPYRLQKGNNAMLCIWAKECTVT